MKMLPVSGNTYDCRDELKALGGTWDSQRKLWLVPEVQIKAADAAVARAATQAATEGRKPLSREDIIAIAVRKRGGTPGLCSSCGGTCKKPYDLCWPCREEREMGY